MRIWFKPSGMNGCNVILWKFKKGLLLCLVFSCGSEESLFLEDSFVQMSQDIIIADYFDQ